MAVAKAKYMALSRQGLYNLIIESGNFPISQRNLVVKEIFSKPKRLSLKSWMSINKGANPASKSVWTDGINSYATDGHVVVQHNARLDYSVYSPEMCECITKLFNHGAIDLLSLNLSDLVWTVKGNTPLVEVMDKGLFYQGRLFDRCTAGLLTKYKFSPATRRLYGENKHGQFLIAPLYT